MSISRVCSTWTVPIACAAVAVVALVLASPARAESITRIQLDVNGVTLQARDAAGQNAAFGAGPFTGSLAFGAGQFSNLNSVLVDGTARPEYHGVFAGVSGQVNFVNDAVAGGALSVAVRNPDATLDTYQFSFAPQSGSLYHTTDALLLLTVGNQAKGDTIGGTFDKARFGGVDVTPWFASGPVNGTFLAFKYNPNAAGFDGAADLDLAASVTAVPLPSAAWGGVALLVMLGAVRVVSNRRAAVFKQLV